MAQDTPKMMKDDTSEKRKNNPSYEMSFKCMFCHLDLLIAKTWTKILQEYNGFSNATKVERRVRASWGTMTIL